MIFQVKDGRYGYPGGRDLWRDINFTVRPGEALAILGPNGAGKTTLLKCMMGLLKWREGQSLLDGTPLAKIPAKELWQNIAYVPQAKQAAFSMTALEMVLLGRNSYMGMFRQPKKEDIEIAKHVMEELEIPHLEDKQCNQLSGGQMQMVLMARALAACPSMLILDEPESNLDFKNQLIILETMARLCEQKHIACVFNTHYPAHALSTAQNALLLDKQGNSRFGKAEEIVCEEHMREAFGVNVHIYKVTHEKRDYQSVLALSIA